MKIQDVRALGDPELAEQLEASHRELFNLRFRLSTRQLTNYREIRKVKKTVARLKTVQRERTLAVARSTTS